MRYTNRRILTLLYYNPLLMFWQKTASLICCGQELEQKCFSGVLSSTAVVLAYNGRVALSCHTADVLSHYLYYSLSLLWLSDVCA